MMSEELKIVRKCAEEARARVWQPISGTNENPPTHCHVPVEILDELLSALSAYEKKDKGEVSDGYHTFNELYEQMADRLIEIEGMDKGKMCVADYQAYVSDMKKLAEVCVPRYLQYKHEKDHFAAILVDHEKGNSLIEQSGNEFECLRAFVRYCLSQAMDICDYDQHAAANYVESRIEEVIHEFVKEYE